jgi:hypothetical protein
MLKKILKGLGITLGILLLFAIIAPLLFRKQLVAALKTEINKSVNAQVDFSELSLSFFRSFPRVSLSLDSVRVVGKGEFAGDTLVQARRVETALNFWSVVRGSDFKIYSISLEEPKINALVHGNGKANWDIALPDTSTSSSTESKPFTLNLQRYSISNAVIRYTDESAGIRTLFSGVNHEGTGDFSADTYTLKTKTSAGAITVRYGGIPYLSEVNTTLDADFEVDNKTNTYRFSNSRIKLNALELLTQGYVQLLNDSSYKMDLSFKAPSTTFREVLSLVPALYQKDFNKIKTEGKASFDGFVKGIYTTTQLPAFALNLDVKDGFFQYPDLPQPVRNINLRLQVDNPDGVADHTRIRLPQAHMEIGGAPVDGHLVLEHPLSSIDLDAALKGRLDLAQLGKIVKLDAGTTIAGIANADVTLRGSVAALQQKRYDNFNAGGTVRLGRFPLCFERLP